MPMTRRSPSPCQLPQRAKCLRIQATGKPKRGTPTSTASIRRRECQCIDACTRATPRLVVGALVKHPEWIRGFIIQNADASIQPSRPACLKTAIDEGWTVSIKEGRSSWRSNLARDYSHSSRFSMGEASRAGDPVLMCTYGSTPGA